MWSRILAAAAAVMLTSGCNAPSVGVPLCMPEDIDGLLVRIDRRAEAESTLALVRKLEARGLRDPVAAAYDFRILPNKPVFHFVLGSGTVDPATLLAEAVASFGGKRRKDQQPATFTKDGVAFECVDFDRGGGLVGISGACAFSDGQVSGYGVRTDGGDASDALKYGAEARRSYRSRAARHPEGCRDVQSLAERATPSTDRDGVAREVVAAILRYNCKALAGYFQAGSEDFFRAHVTPVLREPRDPGEWVCFVLGTLGYPQSETMRIKALEETAGRALLQVSDWGDKAELALVRDGSSWKVDREWAVRRVHDHRVKLDMAALASTIQQYGLATGGAFSDDPMAITGRTHLGATFQRGLATRASTAGDVYVALGRDGKCACVSALSGSGEFLMIRVDRESWTNTRLQTPPNECPSRKLRNDW